MSRPACNKCKQAVSIGEDSWCVGCAAQENTLLELRARWGNPDLRRAANEVLVDAARQIKVLRALSLRLTPLRPEPLPRPVAPGTSSSVGATPKSKARAQEQEKEKSESEQREEKKDEPEPEESYTYN